MAVHRTRDRGRAWRLTLRQVGRGDGNHFHCDNSPASSRNSLKVQATLAGCWASVSRSGRRTRISRIRPSRYSAR